MAKNKQPKNPTRGYLQYAQPPGPRILSTGTSRNNNHLTGQERFESAAESIVNVNPSKDWKSLMPAPGLPIKGEKSPAGRARKV